MQSRSASILLMTRGSFYAMRLLGREGMASFNAGLNLAPISTAGMAPVTTPPILPRWRPSRPAVPATGNTPLMMLKSCRWFEPGGMKHLLQDYRPWLEATRWNWCCDGAGCCNLNGCKSIFAPVQANKAHRHNTRIGHPRVVTRQVSPSNSMEDPCFWDQ